MQGGRGRDQSKKIFIGGLDFKSTEDSLKEHFSKFGELVDVVVMRFPDTQRPRGFGFITYSTDEEVDACQENRPHVVDGKQVETKRATPREARDNPDAGQSVKKVFVGGVSEDIEDEELQAYFEQFGEVAKVTRSMDKDTGKRKRFCFVEFNDYDPVDKCIIKGQHEIGGRRIDVKKAVSREDMAGGGGGAGGRGGRGGRGGGGGGRGGGYGGGRGGGGGGYQNGGGQQWGSGGGGGGAWSQGGGGGGGSWGGAPAAGGWGGATSDYSGYQAGGAADWGQAAGGYGGAADTGYSQGGYGGGPMRSAGAGAAGGYRAAPYGGGAAGGGFQGRGGGGRGGGYRGGM